jgi:hypothetical protein
VIAKVAAVIMKIRDRMLSPLVINLILRLDTPHWTEEFLGRVNALLPPGADGDEGSANNKSRVGPVFESGLEEAPLVCR